MDLDATDRRILTVLQKQGRITNAELSEQVNLSPSACHRRVWTPECDVAMALRHGKRALGAARKF